MRLNIFQSNVNDLYVGWFARKNKKLKLSKINL